ncbi:MAG: hypothetical protein H7337_20085, partial [Rhizobacter sp.]|nr:hypothetical protein [Rhizobacter sp.]
RPAPVQLTWLGYWASTGLSAMDFVLCDATAVPLEAQDQFTEQVWYLPDTRLCFTPPAGAHDLAVAQTPALATGYVTFGSFENLTKVNAAVLRLWARVLQAVPGSRLRIQATQLKDPVQRLGLLQRMAAAGIDEGVLKLVEPSDRLRYLAAYGDLISDLPQPPPW